MDQIVDDAPLHGTVQSNLDENDNDLSVVYDITKSVAVSSPEPNKEPELKDTRAIFVMYGSKRIKASFWQFVRHNYADATVLKFLRARKWNPNAAVLMLSSCLAWRILADVDQRIVVHGEEGLSQGNMEEGAMFIRQLDLGKAYIQGTDRAGRPICYVHVARHRLFDQSTKALEDFIIYLMESLGCLLTYPNDKCALIFDMTGFGLVNMDWKCVHFLLKCLEGYYPELLSVLLIHNAPWIFQGIWRILAPMVDPVVRAKIQFTKSTADLAVHIDPKHLIKQLGGTNNWEWEYTPIVAGENEKMKDIDTKNVLQAERQALIASHEHLTRNWITSEDIAIAKDRRQLDDMLRRQSFVLDPYVRARGVYDRHKNVLGDGRVLWVYPGLTGGEEKEILGVKALADENAGNGDV